MALQKRTVIVTGGAGFIGSHTCVELEQAGFRPVIVDDLRNSQERALRGLTTILGGPPVVHRIDCADEEALEAVFRAEAPVYGVIHFAANKAVGESVKEPLKYYANNVGSLLTVLKVMARHAVDRIVFSSSCTVYGDPAELPVSESAPDKNARSPYGSTKVVCEQVLRDVTAAEGGCRAVMLRYFNPIGAHRSGVIGELPLGVPNNLVPYVAQTAAGIRPELVVHGNDYDTPDGTCIRDYIHVVDLAKAHVLALGALEHAGDRCAVFNVGTGRGYSVLEVLHGFEAATGVRVPHRIGPRREGDVAVVYADTRRSREVLGWRAELDLPTALADAWRWQQHLAKGSEP